MKRTAGGWLRSSVTAVGSAALIFATALPAAAADPQADLDLVRRLNDAFVAVADTVSPAVVVVRVRPKAGAEGDFDHSRLLDMVPEEMRKELQERLDRERKSPRRQLPPDYFPEQGSGVVIREDGFILTNGHVVQNAEKIEVRLRDGRRLPAEVKGIDTESDVAVLHVDAKGLPAAKLGDSAKVRVGQFAIAIGAPFELEYSVTFGHVSAKGRRVMADVVMMDQDFLQTDASINPGNSGGPLVNIEGEVIGINTMIRGLNTGIGFAVPVNLAREVAEQLIETGRFTRAWLGVNIESLGERPDSTPADVPVKEGVLITRILREGPTWGSELEVQDVVVAVDGEAVRDVADLKHHVSRKKVGKPITLDVYRGDKRLQVKVTPGELPDDRLASLRSSTRPAPPEPDTAEVLGVKVRDLDAENAERVGLEKGEGVLVTDVEDDSPAARRHLEPGDVITKVNRRPVRSPKEFAAAMREADPKKGVSVTVYGERGRRFEVLKSVAE